MTEIEYKQGDATVASVGEKTYIVHICNNLGAWGAGFVLPLAKRYPKSREVYFAHKRDLPLGTNQPVYIDESVTIFNMIAQDGFPSREHPVAVSYKALEKCLTEIGQIAASTGYTVQMPRIGCGIGGGRWQDVEGIVKRTLCAQDVPVRVLDFA